MNIILRLWWSLGRGNPVVPSRWQATPSSTEPSRTTWHTLSPPRADADDPYLPAVELATRLGRAA